MASLREIRRKIQSVNATEQITKAMQMVAAARLRRAQAAIVSARPFAVKMEEMIHRLAGSAGEPAHALFQPRPEGGLECLIAVSGDKGLCGAFNAQVVKASAAWIRARQGRKVCVAAVGRKIRHFFHRLQGVDMEIVAEVVGIFPKAHFAHAELLWKDVSEAYFKRGLSSVSLIYTDFKSAGRQVLVKEQLLPLTPPVALRDGAVISGAPAAVPLYDFKYEPDRRALLDALLPRFIKAKLYRVLLESQASELAARMNAMDAASKNASELKSNLNLNLNRQRQAIITKEIAELVGGAEALAA